MRHIEIVTAGMVLLLVSLVGCGGGGGSSPAPVVDGPVVVGQTTKVNGVASKSPITGGTVTAYKIVNNAEGELIDTTTTTAGGSYSLNLGTYTGPVLFKITGGTYTDEATGNPNMTIPESAPLHAIVSNASGVVSVAITPLTELAYQLAKAALTTSAIESANKQVANIFKVYDIIKTQPVNPDESSLAALPIAAQGQDQRDYTLFLATFSQLALDQGATVAETVSYLKNNISSTITTSAATEIQTAASSFFNSTNRNNKTGVTDPTTTNIVKIVGKQVVVKLATAGTIPSGNSIKGMQFEVNLPTGVSVKSNANGVYPDSLSLSGVALSATDKYILGNVTGSKVVINVTSGGFATGEFATLLCDVADNVTTPASGSFSISTGYKVSDLLPNIGTINLSNVSITVLSVVGR
ncbi:MAG: hypothetical protein ACOYL3_24800 [Desulfuromonadaceae bacterium]